MAAVLKIGYARSHAEYFATLRHDPCAYCGGTADVLDHVVPVRRGGPDGWQNRTAACSACNASKHAKSLLGFLAFRLAVREAATPERMVEGILTLGRLDLLHRAHHQAQNVAWTAVGA